MPCFTRASANSTRRNGADIVTFKLRAFGIHAGEVQDGGRAGRYRYDA